MVIVTFFLKTKATIQQVEFVLTLISELCPSMSNFPTTWYHFHKIIKACTPPLQQLVMCPKLCNKVSPDLNIGERDACFQCKEPLYIGVKPKKFFYFISLSSQLVSIFQKRPDLLQQMEQYSEKKSCTGENFSDFQNGDWIQSNISFMLFKWNLALGICIDGIPIYKSSKVSLWPVYCIILNLPPLIRYKVENILLLSCATSPRQPEEYRAICSHLVYELAILNNGVPVENCFDSSHKILRARLCFLTSDLEAKNKLLNMSGYNGYYGCYYCNIKGTYVSNHVYFPGKPGVERTNSQLVDDSTSQINGVKGLTELHQLSYIYENFNTLQSCPIDIMHCVFLGVAKRITLLWLNCSSSSSPFGIKDKILLMEDFTQTINSQCNLFSRKLRKFSQVSDWKAEEWKNWLFYYSHIILPSFLPKQYFQSFFKFSKAIFCLCNTTITKEDLQKCTIDLNSFVEECEKLYGSTICTLNLHLLLHLTGFVQKYGPLWVYWCFPFEKNLGYYKKFQSSTKNPATSFCRVSSFLNFASAFPSNNIPESLSRILHLTTSEKVNEYNFNPNASVSYSVISQVQPNDKIVHYFKTNQLECFSIGSVVFKNRNTRISLVPFTESNQITYILFSSHVFQLKSSFFVKIGNEQVFVLAGKISQEKLQINENTSQQFIFQNNFNKDSIVSLSDIKEKAICFHNISLLVKDAKPIFVFVSLTDVDSI